MSAASGLCGSSSGLAFARCAHDGQTCGDPAPAAQPRRLPGCWSASGIRASRGRARSTHPSHPRSLSQNLLESLHDRHRLHPHRARPRRRRALRLAPTAARAERHRHESHHPRPGPARARARSRAPGGGLPRLGGHAHADRRGRVARPRPRRAGSRRAGRAPPAGQPRARGAARSWRSERRRARTRAATASPGPPGTTPSRPGHRRTYRCPTICPSPSAAPDGAQPRRSRIELGQMPCLPGERMPFGSSASLIVSVKRR